MDNKEILMENLEKLGIELKDENGEFRNTQDVLADLADKWNDIAVPAEVFREVEDFPKSDIALIEIGDCEKESYVTLKGSLQDLHNEPAHTYYYPEDIETQEILGEIKDLMEHYAHVALLIPLPIGWSLEDLSGEN